MRRADIEVPNLAVDVTLCNSLQRRLYLYLFRGSGVSWEPQIWPCRPELPSLASGEKSLQGKLVEHARDDVRPHEIHEPPNAGIADPEPLTILVSVDRRLDPKLSLQKPNQTLILS